MHSTGASFTMHCGMILRSRRTASRSKAPIKKRFCCVRVIDRKGRPMPGEIFVHRQRVIYAQCTIGNHVYHSRYLDILEAARGEFMRALGYPLQRLQDEDFIFPVISLRMKFIAPARYDDELEIQVSLK